MKIFVLILMALIFTSIAISYVEYPTIIPDRELPPYHSCLPYEADMKYHGTPSYYWTLTGSNWTLASWFKPSDFNVDSSFRIKTIGFMGYISNGSAKIYIFLAETGNHPDCTPPEFTKKMYGPYDGHLNNSYPDYDELDIYSLNWYIKKSEIDTQVSNRFWVLYHLPTSPPPYPISDESTNEKNSRLYQAGTGWINFWSGYYPCWCMHVVVEYPPNLIENTSIGTVKALFR